MAKSKKITINVNGTDHEWSEKTITYDEVVNLAYNNSPPTGDGIVFTVTYFHGNSDQEGILGPNSKPQNVHDGERFRVKHATRS